MRSIGNAILADAENTSDAVLFATVLQHICLKMAIPFAPQNESTTVDDRTFQYCDR